MRGCYVGVWGWSLQCLPFNMAILPGQKRRVKNDAFKPFVSFLGFICHVVLRKGGYLWRAAVLGGISRRHVVSIVVRLGAWLFGGLRSRIP